MSWEAVVVVVVALIGAGAALKGWGWLVRTRLLRRIPADAVRRARRGVSLRVLVQGTDALPGMNPKKANRTTGDLVLSADRFLVVSGRGLIADLAPAEGRRFTSVRCPGPGKLVMEGRVPRSSGPPGQYRVEVLLPDAAEWAEALQPFVEAGEEGARFAVRPFAGPER